MILENIKVKKIAFCIKSKPANRFELLLAKSDSNGEDISELLQIYEDAFGEELSLEDVEKAALTREAAKDILRLLGKYDEDIPSDISDAWKKLSRLLIKFVGYGVKPDYGYPKKEVEKADRSWANFAPPIPLYLIKKNEPEIDEESELDEDDEYLAPVLRRLEKLEGEPKKDIWPSIPLLVRGELVEEKKYYHQEEEEKKEKKPQSKQVREEIKKEDESEEILDEWPTIFDASIYRNKE